MYCPKCGTENINNSKFCMNCGNQLKNIEDNYNIRSEKINFKQKFKKYKSKIIICLIIIIIGIITLIAYNLIKNKYNKDLGNESTFKEIMYKYSEAGIPKFIDGTFSDVVVKTNNDILKALEDIKEIMQFTDISNELKFYSEETVDNITYYKFEQFYKNIPVYKQNLIVSVNQDGKILSLSGYYIPNININEKPQMSLEDAEKTALNSLGENAKILSNELFIWANYDKQYLVYVVHGYSDTKASEIIINANNGEILRESDLLKYATNFEYEGVGLDNKIFTINLSEYKGTLLNKKNKYMFYDIQRNISIDDFRNTGPIISMLLSAIPGSTPITVDIEDGKIVGSEEYLEFIKSAISAMGNYEIIYDYYYDVLGRNSYDNKGSKIIVNLGVTDATFSNKDLNNAMWAINTNQMYIGNYNGKSFSASLDVLAHEFTHGVSSFIVDFANSPKEGDENKEFETGALNEAYSDILGSLIEEKNWTIAEDNEVLRNLANPNEFKNPKAIGAEFYYPDGYLKDGKTLEEFLEEHDFDNVIDYDNGGIHHNSTVVSYAAYLMYNNGAFNDMKEMAKVWYNSLFMLSPYSNFEDCAYAVIKSAKNLGLSDKSIYKIYSAFYETGILKAEYFNGSGTITSGNKKISNVKVEIYSNLTNILQVVTESNEEGKFTIRLLPGTYKIKFSKKGFKDLTKNIVVIDDMHWEVEIAKEDKKEKKETLKKVCETDDCINFTIYFLEGNSINGLTENHETFAIEKGKVLGSDIIVETINNIFKNNILSSNGTEFYMNIGGYKMELGWYYKGTNKKFNWNKSLTEDTEIEMKFLNGLLDNDLFINIKENAS